MSRDDLGQGRLLGRHEDADVTGRRIQRSEHGDEQERPEGGEAREAQSGREHECRRADEHAAAWQAVTGEPERDRDGGGSEQRSGHDGAHLERGEAETGEVPGEQHAHQTIDESAQRADAEDAARVPSAGRPGGAQRRARRDAPVRPARTIGTDSDVTGGSSSSAVKGCRR